MEREIYSNDLKFMKMAIRYSEKGRGFTEPNPMVGAVVVKGGRVISTGYHSEYGKEHAEVMALKKVKIPDTTLYLTLEPCIHFGKTPPCVNLIIKKRVKRVVIAAKDPNPIVFQKGIKTLKENNILVTVGVFEDFVQDINRHYYTFNKKKRPYVTLKAGVSIDGKLTDKFLNSSWITSKELREISHQQRGEYQGILVGKNTIMNDNPQLNIRRGKWKGKKFYRVIFDSLNQLPADLKIFKFQKQYPLIIFSSENTNNKEIKCKLHFFIKEKNGKLNLKTVLKKLYGLNISSIIVEGGGEVLSSFLSEGIFDEVILFFSSTILGGKESVQLFHDGTELSKKILLENRKIYNLKSGYILKGRR